VTTIGDQSNQSWTIVRRAQHRAAVTHEATLYSDANARTRRFAVCDQDGQPVWHGRDFDGHDEQWRAELAAAKKAVWLAWKVAERAGVPRLLLNLIIDAEWLTWANGVIGGGKPAALQGSSRRRDRPPVSWISATENPADAFTVCRGNGPRFLRWQDGIDQIEVVNLLSQAGTRTTPGGAR
jgi:hypothetical protein